MPIDKNLLRLTRVTVLGAGAAFISSSSPAVQITEASACNICVNYAVCEGHRNQGYSSCEVSTNCKNSDTPCYGS